MSPDIPEKPDASGDSDSSEASEPAAAPDPCESDGNVRVERPGARLLDRVPDTPTAEPEAILDRFHDWLSEIGLEPYAAYGPARPQSQFLLAEPRVSGHHRGLGASRRSR